MSTITYQQYFSSLITNSDFRNAVASKGIATLIAPGTLEPFEQDRLNEAANQPGILAMRTLHQGVRLSKLLSSLPWTCRLMGDDKLARLLGEFWRARPAASFYYAEESIAFGRFLQTQIRCGDLRVAFLEQVLAEELLRLRRMVAFPHRDQQAPAQTGVSPSEPCVAVADPAV